jgi:hypothetical protein
VSLSYGLLVSITVPAFIVVPLIQDGEMNLIEGSPLLAVRLVGLFFRAVGLLGWAAAVETGSVIQCQEHALEAAAVCLGKEQDHMNHIDRDEIVRLTAEYGGQWGLNHARRILQLIAILGEGRTYETDVVWIAAHLHDWGAYPPWAVFSSAD